MSPAVLQPGGPLGPIKNLTDEGARIDAEYVDSMTLGTGWIVKLDGFAGGVGVKLTSPTEASLQEAADWVLGKLREMGVQGEGQ